MQSDLNVQPSIWWPGKMAVPTQARTSSLLVFSATRQGIVFLRNQTPTNYRKHVVRRLRAGKWHPKSVLHLRGESGTWVLSHRSLCLALSASAKCRVRRSSNVGRRSSVVGLRILLPPGHITFCHQGPPRNGVHPPIDLIRCFHTCLSGPAYLHI